MKNKRRIILILAVIAFLIFLGSTAYTYAMYFSRTNGTIGTDIKKWYIKVNNEEIINKTTLTESIDAYFEVLATEAPRKENTIAPGVSGYFNVLIDYTEVDLDFDFDLSIIKDDTLPDIQLTTVEVDNVVASDDDITVDANGITHVTGHITASTDTVKTKTIKVYVSWYDESDNEMSDEEDTQIPINYDSIDFDVNISFIQTN